MDNSERNLLDTNIEITRKTKKRAESAKASSVTSSSENHVNGHKSSSYLKKITNFLHINREESQFEFQEKDLENFEVPNNSFENIDEAGRSQLA